MKKITLIIIMMTSTLLTGCDFVRYDELETLKSEVSEIEEYDDTALRDEIDKLETDLLLEIGILESELIIANENIIDLETDLEIAKGEVLILQDTLNASNEKLEELENSLMISNLDIIALESDLADSNNIVTNLETEISNLSIPEDLTVRILNTVTDLEDSVVGIIMKDADDWYSTGSGVIYKVSDDLYFVITNNHVIDGLGNPYVRLHDNSEIEMTLLGFDYYTDLAVLTFTSSLVYEPVVFSDYETVVKGDIAIAIGSPSGFSHYNSATFGLVSNTNIYVNNDHYFGELYLQTDAAINPGNSGGGLFNINGELIGINVLKSVSEDIEGMGYSIPINLVETIVSVIESGSYYQRSYIGYEHLTNISDIKNDPIWYSDISIPVSVTNGVHVSSVIDGGILEIAGMIDQDIITEVNGNPIDSWFVLLNEILYKNSINSDIEFTIVRDGIEMNLVYNHLLYNLDYYTYEFIEYETSNYIGEVYNSMKHGEGKISYNIGDYFEGNFSSDLKFGWGTYYWSDGDYFDAYWLDDNNTQDGIFYYNDGTTENWNLIDGEFVIY